MTKYLILFCSGEALAEIEGLVLYVMLVRKKQFREEQ